jgi:hypothetical protein
MQETKFSKFIDHTDNLYYVSDYVIDDITNEEYIQLFYYYEFFYSRTTAKISGLYINKFYYR